LASAGSSAHQTATCPVTASASRSIDRPPLTARGHSGRIGRCALPEHADIFTTVAPSLGCAIAATVLGLNLIGDGLRDVLDPRLRIEQA
jgi:hypothetical protein